MAISVRSPGSRGGTAIGKKIRSILLDPECGEMRPLTELLLYNADRVQHVETVIKPALDAGGNRYL